MDCEPADETDQEVREMKKISMMLIFVLFAFTMAIVPHKKVEAKKKCWYGKYWEYKKTAKKSIKIKGKKLILRGKWSNTASEYGIAKEKKIKKTFKLTKKTAYYLQEESDEKARKVSKKMFKSKLYSDVTYCSIKVKSGKVVKAKLSFN